MICPKACREKVSFDKNKLYMCVGVCMLAQVLLACLALHVLGVLLIFKFRIVKTDLVSKKGLSALLGFYSAIFSTITIKL